MIWDFHGWLFWTLFLCCAIVIGLYGWTLLRFIITWPEIAVRWVIIKVRTAHAQRTRHKIWRIRANLTPTPWGYPYESRLRDKMEADDTR